MLLSAKAVGGTTTTPTGLAAIVVMALIAVTGVTIAVMTACLAEMIVAKDVVADVLLLGGRGRGRGRRRTTPWVDVMCQICNKEGHPTRDCWWRFQDDDDTDDKEAHVASYGVDTNWYQDSGATHHITGELNNLSVRDKYRGNDRVNTAGGNGMVISHVGH
jgi:hypothetical protein